MGPNDEIHGNPRMNIFSKLQILLFNTTGF